MLKKKTVKRQLYVFLRFFQGDNKKELKVFLHKSREKHLWNKNKWLHSEGDQAQMMMEILKER